MRRCVFVILTLAVGLAVAACGTSTKKTSGASTAPSSSSASASTASSTSPVSHAPPPENAAPPLAVKPNSGKGLTLGYISEGQIGGPFDTAVNNSIAQEAKLAGSTLKVCDSQGTGADALQCAKTFSLEHVQGYLNFQPDSTESPAICAAGPKVPVIAIDIQQPPCQKAFMGTNNAYAGYLGGKGVGDYVKAHFNCKYDAFVSLEDNAVGPVNNARMGGYRSGFESVCGPIHQLTQVGNSGATQPTIPTFTSILTRLPTAIHIIVVGINDESVEGAIDAARTAGRSNDIYVSGQGLDNSAYCAVKTDAHWIGDTAYFPEHYGKVGIPYLIQLVKGKTAPKLLYVHDVFVTASTVGRYYNVSSCK